MMSSNFDPISMQKTVPSPSLEEHNIIKACLFTLIVVTHNPEHATNCKEIINTITQQFPCRVIFIKGNVGSQADYLRTFSPKESTLNNSNGISCEEWVIEASANHFKKVPYLIIPHICPDLPVYLLLDHDPTQDQTILTELEKYATRIIFGVEHIDDLSRFTQHILTFLETTHSDVVDVNWAKTKAWRDALSQVFDTECKLQQLKTAKTIDIHFSSAPNQTSSIQWLQSIYLQAWIASCLGWKFHSVEKDHTLIRINYISEKREITVKLLSKDDNLLECGAIFSVELMSYANSHFLLSHEGDSQQIKVHSSDQERCEIPFSLFLKNYQKGVSLVNEIFYQPPSSHYHLAIHNLTHSEWTKCTLQ